LSTFILNHGNSASAGRNHQIPRVQKCFDHLPFDNVSWFRRGNDASKSPACKIFSKRVPLPN
jgi:hypothetical protein